MRSADRDAELFVQLALERGERCLARLDFPAGKFPVAGIDLARRPLAQQESPVLAEDYGSGDFNALRVTSDE